VWIERLRRPSGARAAIHSPHECDPRAPGPDAEGYYQDGLAHLGHRRLAVIDIPSSLQPMASADGRYQLLYNGELYNFKVLRTELELLGRKFRTKGDTEVVLQAFEQWGEKALKKLQGMFALALWDTRDQVLFAARDHLGVKPFHYFWNGSVFAFASELKALIEHPDVKREIDLDALSLYLEAQYIPAPRTIYKGILKLEAGHALELRGGKVREFAYWNPDYSDKPAWSEAEALELLESQLRASVRSMLVADVPLGAFVSGGIDSSVVAALMSQEVGGPIETFNLGFVGDTTQSEHEEAQRVARHIGSNHHPLMVSPADVLQASTSGYRSSTSRSATRPRFQRCCSPASPASTSPSRSRAKGPTSSSRGTRTTRSGSARSVSQGHSAPPARRFPRSPAACPSSSRAIAW
jgi:asparagine synthase (glutamine-hydrolysing)